METVTYGPSVQVGKSSITTIPTSETTLLTVMGNGTDNGNPADGKLPWKSQLAIFMSVAPGGSTTGVKFRYYFTPDNGVTWYPLPTKNASTGVLTDLPSELTSVSYVDSNSNWIGVDEIPMAACTGFKVTGTAVGASATLNSLVVMARDN